MSAMKKIMLLLLLVGKVMASLKTLSKCFLAKISYLCQ